MYNRMAKFFLMLLEESQISNHCRKFLFELHTSSARYLEIRRLINGFRRIVFTAGRSLEIRYNSIQTREYDLILPGISSKHRCD